MNAPPDTGTLPEGQLTTASFGEKPSVGDTAEMTSKSLASLQIASTSTPQALLEVDAPPVHRDCGISSSA
jgi:hypothetical protein